MTHNVGALDQRSIRIIFSCACARCRRFREPIIFQMGRRKHSGILNEALFNDGLFATLERREMTSSEEAGLSLIYDRVLWKIGPGVARFESRRNV